MIHFAVAGVAGSGKSSLINALRGLSNNDPRAAPVGTAETTREIHRYEDSDVAQNQFVWYDIPGAGTLNQASEVDYFRKQGLYIFDCIILLVDSRFTATDVAILRCCSRTKTPVYIVHSKALQHICNAAEDMVGDGRVTRMGGIQRSSGRRHAQDTSATPNRPWMIT
ncbi:hypothetical protein EVJ58_g6784 [Rhodofomes roseus]|uniref:IRG-type G domain-containing protein n=1 Tax=Rhodofomes roseus TaxID=34475 RepID=A0A4Y9Y8S6_9APHY|nr:hypothetical protein EVJ58_g6784 [Rhodofomes roseus]